jgi:hypothetical protein
MNKHLKTTIPTVTKSNIDKTPTYLQQSYIDEKASLPRHALNFQTPKIAFNPLAIRKIDKIKPVDNKPELLL